MRKVQIWKNLRKCKHYGINEGTAKKKKWKLDKIKHDKKTKSIIIMMEKNKEILKKWLKVSQWL